MPDNAYDQERNARLLRIETDREQQRATAADCSFCRLIAFNFRALPKGVLVRNEGGHLAWPGQAERGR
jgi:hypothetical protein